MRRLFFLRFILMGRFCLFSSIFQLPFYTLVFSEWGCFFLLVRLGSGGNTKDFLSLSKKVLVTLIRFICSFFSTARRTNQEAPPQLSGACLYSNPPLLLSLRVFLTPPSLRATSPIFCVAKHRGGVCECPTIPQGIGEGVKGHSPFEVEG